MNEIMTMEVIYSVIGAVIGAVMVFLFQKGKRASLEAKLELEKQSSNESNLRYEEMLDSTKEECNQRVAELKKEHENHISVLKKEHANALNVSKQEGEKKIAEVKSENVEKLQSIRSDYDKLISEIKAQAEKQLAEEKKNRLEERTFHSAELELLKKESTTQLTKTKQELAEQRLKELSELRDNYEAQLKLFKAELTTATEKLLKSRSSELQKENTEQMELLFRPLKENIAQMEKSMNENRDAQNRNNASFEKTIQQMMESNQRLGSQADRLSTALQRKNKVAGNWGELILTELLESQGLEAGVHFDAQKAYKDEETGATKIPDVVLHLADNRDVIVDSKMSLTAFVDYQNAEDEEQRKDALARHLTSVREHIKELTDKSYSNAIAKPRVSADFVIMFVPIEGALQLALSAEPSLWREAFDKKVFIAGGQTLIAALRIIDLTWVNVLQNRNTQNVMDEARKLINRVYSFYEKFQELGRKLDATAKAYKEADQRVKTGDRSILALGNRLEDLGVRGKKALPRPDSTDDYIESLDDVLPE